MDKYDTYHTPSRQASQRLWVNPKGIVGILPYLAGVKTFYLYQELDALVGKVLSSSLLRVMPCPLSTHPFGPLWWAAEPNTVVSPINAPRVCDVLVGKFWDRRVATPRFTSCLVDYAPHGITRTSPASSLGCPFRHYALNTRQVLPDMITTFVDFPHKHTTDRIPYPTIPKNHEDFKSHDRSRGAENSAAHGIRLNESPKKSRLSPYGYPESHEL